jgi:predicted Zn-dependent peptidase
VDERERAARIAAAGARIEAEVSAGRTTYELALAQSAEDAAEALRQLRDAARQAKVGG